MSRGMIMVDGSFLFASINRIRKAHEHMKESKLNIGLLSDFLRTQWRGHFEVIVRVSYYFKRNDTRLKTLLTIPRNRDHWQIIECAEPAKTLSDEELAKKDPKDHDHFARAEKGLDMRLACDALSTAAMGRITDFLFMLNDRDYIPMIEAVQRFGCCTYLTTLENEPPHKMLLDISDLYMPVWPQQLEHIFGIRT